MLIVLEQNKNLFGNCAGNMASEHSFFTASFVALEEGGKMIEWF